MNEHKVLVWFCQDLRLADNPALHAAIKLGQIIPIYILDQSDAKDFSLGQAGCWWLHESLQSLHKNLQGHLIFAYGDSLKILKQCVKKYKATAVYWNRCYQPWVMQRDTVIKKELLKLGIDAQSFNGSLLWEPQDIVKSDGTGYKVFTAFYKNGCLKAEQPREIITKTRTIQFAKITKMQSLNDLKLLKYKDVGDRFSKYWKPSEQQAHFLLQNFLHKKLKNYKHDRDFPGKDVTSQLSPYLQFGLISPNQIWWTIKNQGHEFASRENVQHFLKELVWREFSYNVLFYSPTVMRKNLQQKFDHFTWRSSKSDLQAWQQGLTGYPLVDAGMRELFQTGYMHNRVRMITASFLIKNLRIDWREGEAWFWDLLVDADLASNSFNWQWVAGCGYDAAPYFRIFNPTLQGKKFDKHGDYVKYWIPELKNLPDKYLFEPWKASIDVLNKAKIILGDTYPNPIVDLTVSRKQALNTFKNL
ncbi:deoxyribodipyrimidine photo-lyase [Candidatus Babeliales bacterium]|nr:deoxyribodipyrimidine photo-lyase [Candidatus Babeliales bacterium]